MERDEVNGATDGSSPSLTSQDSTWRRTREESFIPSEPSTPSAHQTPSMDDLFAREISSQPSSRRDSSTTHPSSASMKVDAEDEDVKIAIMALGAMKNLDGRRQNGSTSGAEKTLGKTSTSSAISASSMNSTTVSSPATSTPGTEATSATYASTSSPTKGNFLSRRESVTSSSLSNPTILADLPPGFQFPAIVHDEDGNEMRVDREDMADDDFLKKVSHLPIVRGTLKAYELGKQSSRVVKYGGDFVESSVKAISRPVVSRLGARLGERGVEQLDEFACRQLERIYPSTERIPFKEEKQMILKELEEKEKSEWKDLDEEEKYQRRKAYWAQQWEEKQRGLMTSDTRSREDSREGLRTSSVASESPSSSSSRGKSQQLQTGTPVQALVRAHNELQANKTRSGSNGGSKWGSMLVEAGVTAGGLSAAMSEESMKSLKYCLQWLQYATAHIEHQITILRDLVVKLNHGELDLSSPATQKLTEIKGDVVNTIRGVVDVVGKYAGGALPEPARSSVKAFILSLPARWATVNRAPSTIDSLNRQGSFGNSPSSPSFSSAHVSDQSGRSSSIGSLSPSTSSARQQAAATAAAANRVLTLAVESLDILRSVTVVFGESLDRADLWVERLRVLGLQRKRAHEQAAAEEAVASIDMGMGGALTRGGRRGDDFRELVGGHSPGAESNVSMATNASAKRRRTKQIGSASKQRSSASPRPVASEDELVSDEGSSTETEKISFAGGKTMGISSSTSAYTSHHHHPQHQYQGSSSHRRNKGKTSLGRVSMARTPSAGNTPKMQDLSLHDRSDSITKHSVMDADDS